MTTRDSPCFKEVEEHVCLGIQIDISRVRVDTRRRLANALLAGLLEADGQPLGRSQGRDSSRLRGQLSLDEVLDVLRYHIAQDCRYQQRAASQCRRAGVQLHLDSYLRTSGESLVKRDGPTVKTTARVWTRDGTERTRKDSPYLSLETCMLSDETKWHREPGSRAEL